MPIFSSSINHPIPAGETERWVVGTRNVRGLRVDVASTGSPYEVDILTASASLNEDTFALSPYSSVLPNGAEEFTDTDDHFLGTQTVQVSTVVEITNTGSSEETFTGGINTVDRDAAVSPLGFITKGETQGPEVVRDGQGVGNYKHLESDSVNTDNPISGPGLSNNGAGIWVEDISVADGETINLSSLFGGLLFGHLIITKRQGNTATGEYHLDGGYGISKTVDPEGEFGTTQGQSEINVYGSDTDSDGADEYYLENTGSDGDKAISVAFIGRVNPPS